MNVRIFTIALDAMPFITWHLPVFNRLTVDWRWLVAEGAAMNVKDTAWCRPQAPRLSRDGTTKYLNSLRNHPRVTVLQKQSWDGKAEMCNACLEQIKEPCILMQVDADELWTAENLAAVANLLGSDCGSARFRCRYFVGPNIVITSDNTYGNHHGEWMRAWRFEPGMKFERHEPPVLSGQAGRKILDRDEHGITFDHYAYVSEDQVRFKEQFYGYKDAVHHWRRLQANKTFPARLGDFLHWVKDEAVVDVLHKRGGP